ncbi:MAG: 4Fe-4S dicluster domain-containing protein [bacterium]
MTHNKNMTRSDFLRDGLKSLFRFTAETLENQVEARARKMIIPVLRPPGAIDEISFLLKCTRCDKCIEACPHDAIVRADAKYGSGVDTPMLRPAEAPCYLCEDLPCVNACAEGVLLPVKEFKMGTAHLIYNKCFAYNGQVQMCDYCFDRCPLKNAAIVMEDDKPRVIVEKCTGCGICEYFCPAPGNAIKILPDRINREGAHSI